jgi:hypothetical protein
MIATIGWPNPLPRGLPPWNCNANSSMATTLLPPDFKEFLKLLNIHAVEYLLVGGHAVGYHGYPRATVDMDVWTHRTPDNAAKPEAALREFGFDLPELSQELLLKPERVIRMGVPPIRIEILTDIDGVEFAECYAARVEDTIEEIPVTIISRLHLIQNKQASGRHQDLDDLENL